MLSSIWMFEWSGNVEHFVALERLLVGNSNVESICCLNEVSERKMNLGLQNIELRTLPTMTCLFKGLKKSFSLKNLTMMIIVGCEKLEIIFSISIIMCLPQLHHIRIEDCKELKHIIEDDLENKKSSNFMVAKTVCFPKLKTLVVVTCHKLKNVFPISIYKELPELKVIIIVEAEKLEEIFVCEVDQEVNIPNLRYVAFLNLPSLSQTQRIHFQAVQNRSILRCQELSLTSAMREYDVLGSLIWEFLPGTHCHTVIFTKKKHTKD
ncbi:putative leucine-rich repeat domain, L domain-containing protein [Medicago truncatula]|uniref:Putative leucine-rich repeat domain, L domain-containing protein n=1 Tax=Medicago truncatula TaxID=3880 RepID=A0A396IMW4_MEDTR|nr:putative leucine-rich repeat domain, L domain-containing protein [Medicago truncatula]